LEVQDPQDLKVWLVCRVQGVMLGSVEYLDHLVMLGLRVSLEQQEVRELMVPRVKLDLGVTLVFKDNPEQVDNQVR